MRISDWSSDVCSSDLNQAPFDSEDTNGADGVTVDLSADDDVTCVFTNIPETTPSNSVSIVKTNNANGQGDYTKNEQTTSGATVPFRIVITNTGDEDLAIVSLMDEWPADGSINLLSAAPVLQFTTPGEGTPASFAVGAHPQ